MARFSKFYVVSFVLNDYCYSSTFECIPSRTASYPFKNHAMSQPCNNPSLHVQKGRNFLCKNHLKIGCSNYIKNFVEKSCFFKVSKRLFLKSYAKESSLYGAISHVLYFRKPPGSLRSSHNFCCFQNRYGAKLLVRNMPILIPLFLLIFS